MLEVSDVALGGAVLEPISNWINHTGTVLGTDA
jgi:hypothetical protein